MNRILVFIFFIGCVDTFYGQAFIDPVLLKSDKEKLNVIIQLNSQADISKAKTIRGKEAKAAYVYEALYLHAQQSQKDLVIFLTSNNIRHRAFYIVNMISAEITKAQLDVLSRQKEVASIIEDGKFKGAEIVRDDEGTNDRTVEWNLTKIKADSVWLQYTNGSGVIIGGQDTGYDWDHPAIINQYKGWNGSVANHNFNWHDAIHTSSGNPCGNDAPAPCDDNNHGTHTMGTMVGDDGVDNQIGVAPGAKWIGCRNMDEGYGTLSTYVECFEWFLAPYPVGGNPSQGDPNQAPHVINNSWGCPPLEGCNTTNFGIMETALNTLRLAGTVIVVSAGNSGSLGCGSVSDPAAIFEGSFSVGSTTSADNISGFSSRGPVTIDGSGRLKPNISAPGSSVRSCIPGTGYAVFSGTSMAGPHVAGLVALIIAANPSLAGEVEAIEKIIEETAVPKTTTQNCGSITGTEIPNNTFGFGRIDALKAVKRAKDSLFVPFIKVDQFGYLPNAKKIAILSDPINGYNQAGSYTPSATLKVKNAFTHAVVYSGSPVSWNGGTVHSQSGDKVWWFDFSSLTTSGQYYISDGSVKSEVFTIGTQVYHNVLKTAFNTFYSQRCGCAKLMTHLSDAYDDAVCHSQDINCRFINDPNNSSQYKNMSGGWHDAGDYNKYVNFAYNAVLPMLLSFEYNPQAYNDSLNIPESFNGIPDILDEVKYETDWLLKMQANDGGVYCVVGVQNFASASPPSLDAATRYYGPKTTSASFSTSAMLALTALEFRKVNNTSAQTYANTLQTAAISAWNWGVSNPSVTYYNTGIVAAGEQEVDAYERSMRKLAAAIYLYALTKDNTYKTHVEANYTSAHMLAWSFVYPFETPVQLSLLYYASIPEASTAVATSIKNTYHNSMMTHADNFPAFRNKTDAYRAYLTDANHGWGSNSIKALTGNMYQAMNHYVLNSSKKDSLAMAQGGYLHYLHGANPTGLCYLTHMKDYGAENSINSIYHGWFTDGSSLWDDVRTSQHGPLPGILSGGVNPNYNLDACCPSGCGGSNSLCITLSPPDNQPILKSYLDWNTGWPQNSWEVTENSISYQAAYLMLLSHYVDRSVPYLPNPVVSTIENANISFAENGKSLILRSPDQTWYRLSVSNTGSLSTTLVPVINGQNTRLSNTSLNLKQANSGLLIKSPDNTYWKISVDNGGNLISNSISSLPLPNASMANGDLIIEINTQGMLLKDGDNSCYFLSVANGGKLFLKPVKCID